MDEGVDITNSLFCLVISAECGVKNATKNEEILSTSSDPEVHMNVIEICCHASNPEKPFIHFDRKVQGASPVSKKQSYSVRKVQGALPGSKKQFFSVARKVTAALSKSEKQSFSDAGEVTIPRKQLLSVSKKVRGVSSVPEKQSLPAAVKLQIVSSVPEEHSYRNKKALPFFTKKDGTIETLKLNDLTRSIEINAVSKLNFQLFTEEYLEEMMNVIYGILQDDNWDYNINFRLFADMLETIREYITDLYGSICTLVRDILTVGLRSQRPRQLKRLTISNSLSVMKNLRESKECIDKGSRAIDFLIAKTDDSDHLDFVNVPPETCLSKERYLVICAYNASMSAMYSMYKCYCLAFEVAFNVRECCERYFAEFKD